MACAVVAPGNPYLGVMLPYTPLHHLLLRDLGFPVVATSGNLQRRADLHRRARSPSSGCAASPIVFLVHNRPICAHVDDLGCARGGWARDVLRRARGYAPLPRALGGRAGAAVLAVGAHLKNTVRWRRSASLHQPAHRRPGDGGPWRRFVARDLGLFGGLYERRRRGGAAISIPITCPRVSPTQGPAGLVAVQHHSRTCSPAWPRTRSDAARSWASAGTAPATAGRHDLGRRVPAGPGRSGRPSWGIVGTFRLPSGEWP